MTQQEQAAATSGSPTGTVGTLTEADLKTSANDAKPAEDHSQDERPFTTDELAARRHALESRLAEQKPAAEQSARAVDLVGQAGASDLVHRDPPKAVAPEITVGRTVLYTLTTEDAHRINCRRGGVTSGEHWPHGAIAHFGNYATAGDVLPMLVVKKLGGDMVNGQVFLDGNDTLWTTSVHEGEGQGCWHWPPRV